MVKRLSFALSVRSALNPPVVYVLDVIPQWLVCLVLGSFIVWKALK